MRTVLFLLEKEFKQIFRNRSILVMILVMPAIQLIILPLAANYEVRNINTIIVDHDHSAFSKQLQDKITASGYFKLVEYTGSFKDAAKLVEADKADLILEIPGGFERGLIRENDQKLLITVNAINGTKANIGGAYLNYIIRDFNQDIRLEQTSGGGGQIIDITSTNWYNPLLNYKFFMVPGILAILVTMICTFLCALNIVKEKEVGTMEQINVTPIKKHHFILGKLIPFWVIGLVVFSVGLLISYLIYGIVPVGSIGLLYLLLTAYIPAVLGLGLLISTYCDSQQQAMLIAFFFMMIFVLMGGLFTSLDSMPDWARVISRINPVSYLIEIIRMIVLKGSGFSDVKNHLLIIISFAVIFNSWAILNYRKAS